MDKSMDERMDQLIHRIRELNRAYYTLDQPLVSDKEYDALYDELLELEKKSGRIRPDSPTQEVGGEVLTEFQKHTHLSPLFSLGKSRSKEEVQAWVERTNRLIADYNRTHPDRPLPKAEYMMELKFDGLTINVTYRSGKLILGATRGNGQVGEEVTPQIKTIRTIPRKISYPGTLEVQGEGVMPLSTLEKYNETAEVLLKNARNAAAGAIRNLDPKVTASRHLDCFFYNVGHYEEDLFHSEEEMLDFLRDQGFQVHPFLKKCHTLEEILQVLDEVEDLRHHIDVLTDGVVIKINDLRTREVLGNTAKFPRWALAYKFEAEEVTTILRQVRWQVGRTGKITPTASFDPVEIAGATVSRATLNNYDDICRKQVRLGARILVRRSNEVIPEILGTIDDPDLETREIEKPTHCPACGTELVENGAHLFCPNSFSCQPQLLARLTHYASRDAMNIDGLSEKTLAKLMEQDVREMADLYELTEEDFQDLEGFKEKRTTKLLQAIEDSKEADLSAFLFAIGIPGVGAQAARDLANHFGSFDAVRQAKEEELQAVEDMGPITAHNIVEFFHDPTIAKAMDRLLGEGIRLQETKTSHKEQFLSGKKLVVTGTIEGYKRKELEDLIRSLGGKAQSSVSKETDLVLAGEKAGSKKDKAQELGVEILEEDRLADFLSKLEEK